MEIITFVQINVDKWSFHHSQYSILLLIMVSKLCFIDWDDTLLCSSWIVHMKKLFGNDVPELRPSFSLLEAAICKLLDTIRNAGYRIYIITNSETGWVELASRRYIPSVLDKLEEFSIPIISARSQYEAVHGKSQNPLDAVEWKKEAFMNLLQSFCIAGKNEEKENIYALCGYIPADPSGLIFDQHIQVPTKVELLVIGDSHLDVQAAESASTIPSVKVKIIKCIEFPNIFTLITQLRHMADTFDSLMINDKHINICPDLVVQEAKLLDSKLQVIVSNIDKPKNEEPVKVC